VENFHVYEPAAGHGLAHDPLNSIVAPRPIGWISSRGADGVNNLAPYSFFNLFNYRPPIIGFASTGWKDSVANIQETGVFAWNLVTEPLARPMNETAAMVSRETDEFALAGLTPAPCAKIDAAYVAESPVNFECRLTQLIRLTNHQGAAIDTWLVLGEAVLIRIHQSLIEGGVYDTVKSAPVLRGGGPADYFTISEATKFKMGRPGT
jgi:flavin reductase (DIM6/NTAB) family NADH-FMN oxidoreductase RutF